MQLIIGVLRVAGYGQTVYSLARLCSYSDEQKYYDHQGQCILCWSCSSFASLSLILILSTVILQPKHTANNFLLISGDLGNLSETSILKISSGLVVKVQYMY